MRYRRTKIILPPKNAPLDKNDLIKLQVEKEDKTILPTPPIPKMIENPLKPSVGLYNMFRSAILTFKP